MAKHVSILFSGTDHDAHGLPTPFHRYEVYVSRWGDDGAIATVVSSTTGSPTPTPTSFVSPKSKKHALKLADEALRALHPDLQRNRG
ncbi:MAG TPA: hypothetical protein VL463_25280 [Kofleriaceae bacterium]|jgi:hypothetical protein|nr:hypothetical protein [Kofleriaceae bacterium]